MRARPNDAGPNEPDFPEECPICGADNVSSEGELLDESHLTCGRIQCLDAERKRVAEERKAEQADYEAWKRDAEAEQETRECGHCGASEPQSGCPDDYLHCPMFKAGPP